MNCPQRGSPMQLIAAVTERAPVQRILLHLGEPPWPPPISPARSPPDEESFDWDQTSGEAAGGCEPSFEPPPEFDKSSGQTICTAKRPEGSRTRRCAMNSIKPSAGNRFAAQTPRRLARRAGRRPPCGGAGSSPPKGRCGRLRTTHFPRPKPDMAAQALFSNSRIRNGRIR